MGERKAGGYIFRSLKACHRPYHVHIYKDNKEVGVFDIENQRLLARKGSFNVPRTSKLGKALKTLGYLI